MVNKAMSTNDWKTFEIKEPSCSLPVARWCSLC